MTGLLRIIFIFGIIYIIYRFLTRYLFPLLLGNFVNRHMNQTFGEEPNKNKGKTRREGEVTIDNIPETKKNYPKNTGEYVDFEEIKE